jgi:ribosomal protein L37AE/L43A
MIIATLEDRLNGKSYQGWLLSILTNRSRRLASACAEHVRSDRLSPVELRAFVNAGRWVVMCPTCSSAQEAHSTLKRFWCVDCQQAREGGAWCPVLWPDERAAIEAALLLRPDPRTRNWMPGETVEQLIGENVARGIGGAE